MSFDPYHQWLGIRDDARPPNHYRLLGIDTFESDSAVIANAADRQMAHLRTFQHGPHSDESQVLLNEVAAARVCLLDEDKKNAYDVSLRSVPPEVARPGDAALPLGRPGRGPRAEKPWYFWVGVFSPMLFVALGLLSYRMVRERRANASFEKNEREIVAAPADTSAEQIPIPEPDRRPSGQPHDPPQSSTVESSDTTDSQIEGEEAAPAEEKDSGEADPADPKQKEMSLQTPTEQPLALNESSIATWGELPEWRAESMAVSTESPLDRFLFALSQRDVTAAGAILTALKKNPGVDVDRRVIDDASLVWDAYRQFWHAFDSAASSVVAGQQLTIGQLLATVSSVGDLEIELEASSGDRRTFSLARRDVVPRVAIGMVEHHFRLSEPVAWRLTATFLAIDKSGNVALASQFGRRADLQGLNWDFLDRGIRRLRGLPELSAPENELEVAKLDGPSNGANGVSIPSPDDQKTARSEILRPELAQLKDQNIPRERWGAELYQKSRQAGLSDAATYVLLRYARQRATTYHDVDTVWAAIESLEQKFGADGEAMKFQSLEAMARRKKGVDRRRLADLASGLARDAVLRDNYQSASRFATLAQSIGRSVGDADYTRYLQQIKKNVLAVKNEYEHLQPVFALSKKHPDDERVRADIARFEVLTKGNFDGLPRHQKSAGPALREQIQKEVELGSKPENAMSLGESWFRYARTLQRTEKSNAYDRAAYWLKKSLPIADRDDTIRIREMLDTITKVVGRESSVMDLTEALPVLQKVGFGSLGVNENPDVNNSRVAAVPEIDGKPIARYLWACGPSTIEFIVPAGAKTFTATGVVNAATNDGLKFVVSANGKIVFSSNPILGAGSQLPIQVKLPRSTQVLRLDVDSLNNNVGDHAYWANPQLSF